VVYLAQRVRRWQRGTTAFAAIAALLALYIAAGVVAPNLVPLKMRLPAGGQLMTQTEPSAAPGRAQQDRLVAVLQQGPTAPAFLVTVDTRQRKLFVRRVSASAEGNKSYELWLISSHFPAPRSLGVVGIEDFTQRALPANFDTETLGGATYAVSLEPAGGSKTGAPTGPVLFTGKAVESLPSSAPATPKT
jgi:anti-sigma-K factor RskA